MDSSYTILNVDPNEEQERDLVFFSDQGVSRAFLENIFKEPSDTMWYPTTDELLEARVVHEVVRATPIDHIGSLPENTKSR
jgi:hypothetical protein